MEIDSTFSPVYNNLPTGELERRAKIAYEHMIECDLCARQCGVNRMTGASGVCRIGIQAKISSFGAHFGEEKPLSGWRGSGTIFFTRCNLRCQYCQNFSISQTDSGYEVETDELASIMINLQNQGCHNINLVSPSHVVPQILRALAIAVQLGLHIPLVYNTGGYDSLSTLKMLDGVIDIYMPDMKYSNCGVAYRLSRVRDYPSINRVAVLEMHRQVGDLQIDKQGLAQHGLLIRHLVLPRNLAGTKEVMKFIERDISRNTYVNIMAQYHPAYNSHHYPEINRPITDREFQAALEDAIQVGLTRLDRITL